MNQTPTEENKQVEMNQAPTQEINKPPQNQKAYEEGQIVLKSQKLQLCQSGLAS
ncbi:hypothetical protein LCGC14_0542610 [marine sediment metagenome]|uniref:Uncharacterized protein n=1 Tax=marine sediment metagenome TaxID=412755 RepID=A0A0F9SAT6_9ZZZZ